MKKMSSLLYCCGLNGIADFTNQNARASRCCAEGLDYSGESEVPGCADLSLKRLRKFWHMFFIVPSCVSFVFELILIVCLSLAIRRLTMVEKNSGTAIYRREEAAASNE